MATERATVEAVLLNPDDVAAQTTQKASEVLGYYSSDKLFRVEDNRTDGNGQVVVAVDWGHGSSTEHYQTYQTFEFNGGALTQLTSEYGGNWYQFNPETRTVQFGTYRTEGGNAQWHMVRGVVSPESQELEEVTRIQVHTDLGAYYQPATKNGVEGFNLDEVKYSQTWPLSKADTAKFLPNGRFISLDDVLASVIDPERSNMCFMEKVKEIDDTEGFPKFDWHDTGRHAKSFVHPIDRNKEDFFGFSHPLKDNPDGWLVFVRFGQGEKNTARALLVEVDRNSVRVEDADGVPTINVTAKVDGETFSLIIPEERYGWEEKTEANAHLAAKEHTREDGTTAVLIPITSAELTESIAKGYYFDDMVDGVLTAFYDKYYRS